MKIGFIGLGNMGAPMARNLAQAGHDVTGYDVIDTAVAGVKVTRAITQAAAGQEVVVTMLPNGAILKDVAAQILPHMEQDAVLLDCSTVDVESATTVAQDAMAAGVLAVTPLTKPIAGRTYPSPAKSSEDDDSRHTA